MFVCHTHNYSFATVTCYEKKPVMENLNQFVNKVNELSCSIVEKNYTDAKPQTPRISFSQSRIE